MREAGTWVSLGNGQIILTNHSSDVSRDQRYRGMAKIQLRTYYRDHLNDYAMVNLHSVREALDQITLEDESAVVDVPLTSFDDGYDYDVNGKKLTFCLGNGGSKVRMKLPCGERRVYRIATLDRALSELGA